MTRQHFSSALGRNQQTQRVYFQNWLISNCSSSSSAASRPSQERRTIDGRAEKLAILNNVSSSQHQRQSATPPQRLCTILYVKCANCQKYDPASVHSSIKHSAVEPRSRSRIRRGIFVCRKSAEIWVYLIFFLFHLIKITSRQLQIHSLAKTRPTNYKIVLLLVNDNSFKFRTVVTWFEQFAACFFSRITDGDNFSNPDMSRKLLPSIWIRIVYHFR